MSEKLGEVSVSMAIIKPELIENKATRDAESIIEQVPGVQINENQASIRGGSGWSYGAGSQSAGHGGWDANAGGVMPTI